MSIQRFSSNSNRVPDPAGAPRSPGAASRAQSPFWQMFTAGGTPPASNATPQSAPAAQTKQAAAITATRSPLPPAVPAKLPAPARNLAPTPRSVPAVTRAPEARRQNDTVGPNTVAPDPVAAVRAALERLGLNPQQFNMRIDQNPIRFGDRQYDYPLLRVDLPNESVGFHLESVMRDPLTTAMNISGMMGRPVMNIPPERLPS